MNKAEMIREVTAKANEKYLAKYKEEDKVKPLTQMQIEYVLDSLSELVLEEAHSFTEKDKIVLPGIGSFKKKTVKAASGSCNGRAWSKPAYDKLEFVVFKSVKVL